MELSSWLTPGLILIIGGMLIPLVRGQFRNLLSAALPFAAFFYITQLEPGNSVIVPFLGYDITLLRVDAWSKVFGYVFTLSAAVVGIYGYYLKRNVERVSSMLYIGSALGVVFAGDLITVYIFWELMAITSVFLILARGTKKAQAASNRYVLVHIFGGLILLAGILLYVNQTGSISFDHFQEISLSTVLILIGFLVNAAAVPLSSWLPDAYPESTVVGGVILSAYTSKTAVYALIRGFPGWEMLMIVGCIMAIYGAIYALLENDMRRILSFCIVNQVGFMVVAVGIGTPIALAGAAAHAFCHIIYKALLWMSAGAILHRTGKTKLTELGGLYRTMPYTFILTIAGLATVGGAPLTSGFISKAIILYAAEMQHFFWVWLILEIASAGVFLTAGIKFPYFAFFGKDKGLRPKEANKTMLFAMAVMSFICIYLGIFPETLYNILPNSNVVFAKFPHTFSDIYIHHFAKVLTKSQLLLFSLLAFFLFLPFLKRTNTISLDFDWSYRKGWKLFYDVVSKVLNGANHLANEVIVGKLTGAIIRFFNNAPAKLAFFILNPFWTIAGLKPEERLENKRRLYGAMQMNTFPIGLAAVFALIILSILFVL